MARSTSAGRIETYSCLWSTFVLVCRRALELHYSRIQNIYSPRLSIYWLKSKVIIILLLMVNNMLKILNLENKYSILTIVKL